MIFHIWPASSSGLKFGPSFKHFWHPWFKLIDDITLRYRLYLDKCAFILIPFDDFRLKKKNKIFCIFLKGTRLHTSFEETII